MMFEGKIAVVTGAAGGIGRTIASRFAVEGATLVLADREEQALAKAAEVTGRSAVTAIAGDLRDKNFCRSPIDDTVARHGRIDVLVNNAGIITRGTVLETSDDDWDLTLDVNVSAVFYTCRAAIRHMTAQKRGAIVNVASTLGLHPGPRHAAYCMSKGAVAILSKCLGRDHARDSIRVNAVSPSVALTPIPPSRSSTRRFRSAGSPSLRTSPTSSPFSRPTRPVTSPARPSRSTAQSRFVERCVSAAS